MEKYIAILRGINVSGKNILPMNDLRYLMEKEGFKNVQTYIQSGNILFAGKKASHTKMAELIQSLIRERFKYEVPVIVFDSSYLAAIINKNPFLNSKNTQLDRLYVTFLSTEPKNENVNKLMTYSYSPDEFVLGDKSIYLHCPKGYGTSKLSNNFFESKLKVTATTRNWNTVNALVELSAT